MTIKQYRQQLLVWLTHSVGMPYFKLMRRPVTFQYDQAGLAHLPQESVGKALYEFLAHHNLDLLPYYEKHDIKHIILGYPPTEAGEVSLQCFMLANGRWTFPVLLAVVFGFLTMPEYWSQFLSALQRGYRNKPLSKVRWIDLLPFPLTSIQNILLQPRKDDFL